MQQLVLDIEDSRYTLLLQFLRTLDYVKVMPDPTLGVGKYTTEPQNQLALLQQLLHGQSKPLFQNITDPVTWQKQQRDEWS